MRARQRWCLVDKKRREARGLFTTRDKLRHLVRAIGLPDDLSFNDAVPKLVREVLNVEPIGEYTDEEEEKETDESAHHHHWGL